MNRSLSDMVSFRNEEVTTKKVSSYAGTTLLRTKAAFSVVSDLLNGNRPGKLCKKNPANVYSWYSKLLTLSPCLVFLISSSYLVSIRPHPLPFGWSDDPYLSGYLLRRPVIINVTDIMRQYLLLILHICLSKRYAYVNYGWWIIRQTLLTFQNWRGIYHHPVDSAAILVSVLVSKLLPSIWKARSPNVWCYLETAISRGTYNALHHVISISDHLP